MSDTPAIEVDGAVVRLGDGRQILVQGDGGHPARLKHVSEDGGHAVYQVGNEQVALQFVEVQDDAE